MPAMPAPANVSPILISLRPAGEHAGLRRAAARRGMALVAVSPWRLQPRADAASGQALREALQAPVVVFTSPAAARHAAALSPLQALAGTQWLAVGEATARALRAAGVADVLQPERMDSEGLLAMSALSGTGPVGLVTAPGGRGMLAAELARRGVEVRRADVYSRVPLTLPARLLTRLQVLPGRSVLALSSGEALRQVMAQLPEPLAARWRANPVVAASDRLVALAEQAGFVQVQRADGPMPAQLVDAALTSFPPS